MPVVTPADVQSGPSTTNNASVSTVKRLASDSDQRVRNFDLRLISGPTAEELCRNSYKKSLSSCNHRAAPGYHR